jgi:anoctamin-10
MEIKGIYDDYNLGDLIIVFQNPDADGVKNIPITFKEAEKIYDDVLTQKNDDVSESQLKKEKEAFLLSFLTLDDYETEKEKKKRKELEEKLKKEEEAKLDSESDEDKSKSD